MRVVVCDHCKKPMYRTDGQRVLSLESEPYIVQNPINVTVNDLMVCFCTAVCASLWFSSNPENELFRRGGYRLF